MFRNWPFLLILCLVSSCSLMNQEDNILAQVGDAKLYEKDVLEAIPSGLNQEDSLLILKGIVNRWTEEQAMYQQALENLPEEMPAIQKEIEKYKRTLYIFQYENELLKSKLDSVIPDTEISNYFDEHKEEFVLRQSILKFHFIITGINTKGVDKILEKFKNPNADDLSDLSKFCSTTAYSCNFEDNWSTLDEAKVQIKPLGNYLKTNNLTAGNVIKIQDSTLLYAIKINELKIKEDIPPLDFVKNDIREIILSKRKSILLNSLRNDIFTEAKNKNKVEAFLPENK